MNVVKVSKNDLLEKLKINRENHKKLYDLALEGYRVLAIAELEKNLAKAKEGGTLVLYVNMQAPQDHTEDYDNVIAMLEMSVENEVTLEAHDFQSYVMDKWHWAKTVGMLNSSYAETVQR